MTITYGDERLTLHTAMPHAEFNAAKRKVDEMLMRLSVEHATALLKG